MKIKDVTLQPLNEILQEYGEEVEELVFNSLRDVAKETSKELRSNSPRSGGNGVHYYKGWTQTPPTHDWKRISVTVYNKTKPWLTHLLNDGYALKKGGRVPGDYHIDMAEDFATDLLEKKVMEELSKL